MNQDKAFSKRLTIALVQMACGTSTRENMEKAISEIESAAAAGAKIVCLQELFAGLYPCQSEDHRQFDHAEAIPGPSSEILCKTALKHGVVVIGSLFERRAPGLFHNTAVVIDADGTLLGKYRKMHIPDDPFYYEKFYFTPGDLGFRSFETQFGNVGVCICWDQWFPEAARLTALSGAEIIFYPTAIGWLPDEKKVFGASQVSAWQTMMKSHAIANGVFIAATNRVGTEGQLQFWGNSFVSDPTGSMIGEAPDEVEKTLLVDCNLDQIEIVRTHWPFLRDRRIDAYGKLNQRYRDDYES